MARSPPGGLDQSAVPNSRQQPPSPPPSVHRESRLRTSASSAVRWARGLEEPRDDDDEEERSVVALRRRDQAPRGTRNRPRDRCPPRQRSGARQAASAPKRPVCSWPPVAVRPHQARAVTAGQTQTFPPASAVLARPRCRSSSCTSTTSGLHRPRRVDQRPRRPLRPRPARGRDHGAAVRGHPPRVRAAPRGWPIWIGGGSSWRTCSRAATTRSSGHRATRRRRVPFHRGEVRRVRVARAVGPLLVRARRDRAVGGGLAARLVRSRRPWPGSRRSSAPTSSKSIDGRSPSQPSFLGQPLRVALGRGPRDLPRRARACGRCGGRDGDPRRRRRLGRRRADHLGIERRRDRARDRRRGPCPRGLDPALARPPPHARDRCDTHRRRPRRRLRHACR